MKKALPLSRRILTLKGLQVLAAVLGTLLALALCAAARGLV